MATILLNYSGGKLWWSTDGANWGIVGPKSPTTIVKPNEDIDWQADETIDDFDIEMEGDNPMGPISGNDRNRNGRVKHDAPNGSKGKYHIHYTPTGGKRQSVDPDIAVCNPPCNPGTGTTTSGN